MKNFRVFFYWTALSFIFLSLNACEDKENVSPSDKTLYQNQCGYFIINEGNFSGQNGEISFRNFATCNGNSQTETITNDLYFLNNNKKLSSTSNSTVQSAFIHQNKVFSMASETIEVINITDFKKTATIDQVENARYGVVANNKLYVSDWGVYNDIFQTANNKVYVFNATTYSLIKTINIPSDYRPEMIVNVGNKIYVATGGNVYDVTQKKIQVIDTSSDAIVSEITLSSNPLSLFVDANNKIWAFCGDNKIQRINPQNNSIEETISLEVNNPIGYEFSVDKSKNIVYFITDSGWSDYNSSVYSLNLTSKSLTKLMDGNNFYGIGFDAKNNEILVSDHQNFAGKGKVHTFSATGTNKNKTYEVGYVPNGFLFE
jgi:hypothetical protein